MCKRKDKKPNLKFRKEKKMGITMEQTKKTCKVSDVPIGGTIMYASLYLIKAEYEDGEEDMITIFVDLLDGSVIDIAPSVLVVPVELIMREKTDA